MAEFRLFVICYSDGSFYGTSNDIIDAHDKAIKIDGIIGELVNVHKPLQEKDIPEPVRSQIIHALEHPESRVIREIPKRKDVA